MMDENQRREIFRYLKRSSPVISRRGEGASRRIEGEWSTNAEEDVHGYKAVVVYIQQGLGQHTELINRVLSAVASFQHDNRLQYLVCLFSFGWEDGKLHHAGQAHQARWNSLTDGWAEELATLAGTDVPMADPVVTQLFPLVWPSLGAKGRVSREDLLIFFCDQRTVKFSESVATDYHHAFQKNTLWFFLGEEPLGIEYGTFVPKVVTEIEEGG